MESTLLLFVEANWCSGKMLRRVIKPGRFVAAASLMFLFSGATLLAQSPTRDLPHYQVDASWPKELPDNWILGHVEAIAVDKNDHIWVLPDPDSVPANESDAAQTPPRAECCIPAPGVIEFDAAGDVLKSWGKPGYVQDWPTAEHGMWVDKDLNVWIGGIWAATFSRIPGQPPDRSLPWDRQVLKFNSDGKQLLEIGHPMNGPANNQDPTYLGGPAGLVVDEDAREVYIADGYMNKRVVVYDSLSGAFKRGWGAYGIQLGEVDNAKSAPYDPSASPSKQFRSVSCVRLSADGLLYVCDRTSDRIQVFTKQGQFVKEFIVAPGTRGLGSTWALAFSHDPQQKYLLVGDGENDVIWIVNRADGAVAGKFGHKGHSAGQFALLVSLAMDSKGNLYTSEVAPNSRIQKFVLTK